MIPVVDLRSLWASFLENPAQFAVVLLATIVIFTVAIVVYRKVQVRYRIPLTTAYVVALLVWANFPMIFEGK